MTSRLFVLLTLPALLGALAPSVPAAAAPAAPGLRAWLQAVEAVPTAEQLRRAGGPEVARTLDQVVGDTAEPTYARHRAVSFLAILDTPEATRRLQARTHLPDADLRATAALAWAAGPGRRRHPQAWREIDRLLADPAVNVRTAAARGLEFVADGRAAHLRVLERQKIEKDPGVLRVLGRIGERLRSRAPASLPSRPKG